MYLGASHDLAAQGFLRGITGLGTDMGVSTDWGSNFGLLLQGILMSGSTLWAPDSWKLQYSCLAQDGWNLVWKHVSSFTSQNWARLAAWGFQVHKSRQPRTSVPAVELGPGLRERGLRLRLLGILRRDCLSAWGAQVAPVYPASI